jgi:hypothetical protein
VVSTFLFYWCKGNVLYGFGFKAEEEKEKPENILPFRIV